MKTRTLIILTSCGVATAILIGLPLAVKRSLARRIGPVHTFELTETPAFLTEGLALTKAYVALRLDGVDTAQYEPRPDGRTKAPDGAIDRYLARNTLNANRGVIMFTNASNTLVRFVSVELNDNKVKCQSSIGK